MKWGQTIAIAAVIALGLPGIYLVCLAAGVNPVDRLMHPAGIKRASDAQQRFPEPVLPEPPESKQIKDFDLDRNDGAKIRYYESKLSRDNMAEAMQTLMCDNGWELDKTWNEELGAQVKDAVVVVFRRPGWHCEIYIYDSKTTATGSEVSVSLLPTPR
jgi:hypothetical protein